MLRDPIAFLLIAATSYASNAAIYGLDDRKYVRTDPPSPYSPIGLVEGFHTYATGTLINRCDVLTVQHLAVRSNDPTGERVTFIGAVGSGHRRWSEGTIIAAGGLQHLKPSDRRFYDDVGSDWMIARLDDCLGDKLGWAKLATEWPHDGKISGSLQDAGFPIDRNKKLGLSIDPECEIRAVAPRVLFHDCATMGGNSGGPLFRLINEDGVQRIEIVGIVSAAWSYSHDAEPVRGSENMATAAWNVKYDASLPQSPK